MAQALPALAGAATGPAGIALAVAGTALSGLAQFQASRAQEAILKRQAQVAEINAQQAVASSQVAQQDRDFNALQEIARVEAGQGASGFSFGSGSFGRSREQLRTLARRDSLRIRQQGDAEAQNFRTQGASARAQAKLESRSRMFNLVSTGLGIGNDLLTGAARVNQRRASDIRREAIGSL